MRLFPSPSKKQSVARAAASTVESLEVRRLFAVTAVRQLPAVNGQSGTTAAAIDLSGFIDDPAVNTQVRFTTELGNIDLETFDQQKPNTVRNFLNYVRQGRYDGTIIHRSTAASTGLEVIQGGGYKLPLVPVTHVPTDPAIQHEGATISNARGTIAMARTDDPNSATSEWFINTANNTALDAATQPPGYVVFGQVINNTLPTVDAIHAVPTFQAISPYGEIPLRNYTQTDLQNNTLPTANNVISVTATTLPKLTYTVTSTNPALVNPAVSGNRLTLQFGQGDGSAQVTVTGAGAGGQSVSQTFAVNVVSVVPVTLGGQDGAKSVTFTDADGTVATVSLKGPGTATVNFSGTGVTPTNTRGRVTVTGTNVAASNIAVTGSNAGTSVTVAARGGSDGAVTLGGLTTDGAVRSIAARAVNLAGNLTTGGAVGTLDLGGANGSTLAFGGAGTDRPASLRFGTLTDTSINSSVPLRSVSATSFVAATNGGAGGNQTAGTLTAPAVGSLSTRGDFAQNVTVAGDVRTLSVGGNLAGSTIRAATLGSLSVRGDVTGSTVNVTRAFAAGERPLGRVNVGGAINNSAVRATGNIGTVSANAMTRSAIFAAIAETVPATSLPATADFTAEASITSVRVRTTTTASNVAAVNLGRLSLGTVQPAGGSTTPFGLSADRIASAAGQTAGGARFNLRRLETTADVQQQTAGLDLGNFRLTLV